jgi:hypothetical protein
VPPGRIVSFAPLGRLVVVDDGERVVCHLFGRALAMLGASHLRQHGWTAAEYREEFLYRTVQRAVTGRRRVSGERSMLPGHGPGRDMPALVRDLQPDHASHDAQQ